MLLPPSPPTNPLTLHFGYPAPSPTLDSFAGPLFSCSYKLLLPQLPCFDSHANCPGVVLVSLTKGSLLFLALLPERNPISPLFNHFRTLSQKCRVYPKRQKHSKTSLSGHPPLYN